MLKVALIVPVCGDDSAISTPVVTTLTRFLASEVELHLFPLRHPTGDRTLTFLDATVHPVSSPVLRLRSLVPEIVRKIRAEHASTPFDIVHALWLFEPGAIAVASARLLRVPSVVSIGGSEVVHLPDIEYGGLRTRRGRVMNRQVLRRATLVTGGSRFILDRAACFETRKGDYHRAPLPVDTGSFLPGERKLLPDPTSPRLLHAASLIPVKDQETLIRSFAEIHYVLPNARLTIAGEDPFGYRQQLERLTKDLNLDDAVRFLGAVPEAEMPSLYQEADLFLLSSRHESQGMVVLEAAASGVPSVGTAVGVLPELQPAAMTVPTGSPRLLAERVLALLGDVARLRQMGAAARCRMERDYSGPVATRRFLDLYQLAVERHAA